uniref:BED-type domain-containing protein n=1 Tax=Sinocyclocheilus anshuiensis TaxID=1608454 RepID=A0A671P1N0_9TELE
PALNGLDARGPKMKLNMSLVWNYFEVADNDDKTAVCKLYTAKISRGGTSVKNFNTANLITHLKCRHAKEHDEFVKAKAEAALATKAKCQTKASVTPSIAQVFDSTRKFKSDSTKAREITRKVMEFMALDDQPFSVVEDTGFQRLVRHLEPRYTLPSRCYFADVCLPEIYNRVADHVHKLLHNDSAMSFTTDIWSSDVSPTSMLSLTAQWIDCDFKLKVLLHSQEFTGSHTSLAISQAFTDMLDKWKIDRSRVHAVVRDNARNMAKAMTDSEIMSLPCMAHSLQLAVNEGILSQRSVTELASMCRKIVGHFKHSQLASSRLQSIQSQMDLPPKRLKQDVNTRWNSTFYMMQSLLEQKRALAAYAADYELPVTLTAQQWTLMEKDASAADIIPLLETLKRLLSKEADSDHGVKTMKKALLEAVQKQFRNTTSNHMCCIATVLDPRYKDKFFDADTKQQMHEMIVAEIKKLGHPGEDQKKARIETRESITASFSAIFNEIVQENGTVAENASVSTQVASYLAEPVIPRHESALTYWAANQGRLPELAQVARK